MTAEKSRSERRSNTHLEREAGRSLRFMARRCDSLITTMGRRFGSKVPSSHDETALKRLLTTAQHVTSTIHAALEQGEGRPGRIRGSRPGVGGARLAPASPKRPVSTAWALSLIPGPNAATSRAALRPMLSQSFASMRLIEELIQYRAQFKIDWLSNDRGLRLRPKLTELIEKRTLNRASRSRNVIR